MNSWLLLRRLRGPAFLILVGITALLNQWGVLSFGRSWPLYLILAGIFGLAERAVMVAAPPAVPDYPGAYPTGGYGSAQGYAQTYPGYAAPPPAPAHPAAADASPVTTHTDPYKEPSGDPDWRP
jgi:hypothetical protein